MRHPLLYEGDEFYWCVWVWFETGLMAFLIVLGIVVTISLL